jgi:hypothetical protein
MEPTTTAELRAEVKKGLERLQALRDELRVQSHLAGMDAKKRWDELEPKLADVERAAEEATEASRTLVADTVKALQSLRDSIRKG